MLYWFPKLLVAGKFYKLAEPSVKCINHMTQKLCSVMNKAWTDKVLESINHVFGRI